MDNVVLFAPPLSPVTGDTTGTLLNLLFGTRFQVMDSQRGRSQTTKGIWMGRSANPVQGKSTETLVLDVEGTDGRERGEEQKVGPVPYEPRLWWWGASRAPLMGVRDTRATELRTKVFSFLFSLGRDPYHQLVVPRHWSMGRRQLWTSQDRL